jgi:hypothetical protein
MEKLFGAVNQPSIPHGAVMAVGSLQAQESLVHSWSSNERMEYSSATILN